MRPLVSVVVPTYNHERFVTNCLRSVADQDYRRIELIVIDDASTDATAARCQKFLGTRSAKARFERIVFRRHERNQGAHIVLNEGIEAAQGRYITFLNSDDYYAPSRIDTCVRAAHGADPFIFTAVQPVGDAGQEMEADELTRPIQRLLVHRALLPSLSFGFLGRQIAVSTGNMFLGRELLLKAGRFAALRYCHDWDMALRLIRLVEPRYLPDPLYFYRYHAQNTHKKLRDLGELETEQVLRRYFRAIKLGEVRNPLAPSPVTWPGVFEMFAKSYGVYKWWQAESGAYPRGARVIAAGGQLERIEL
jgi:glycosyltransferase involved in cell wall biosynthesis